MASGHQRVPHQQAEHMAAPTSSASPSKKSLANREPSTHGYKQTSNRPKLMSALPPEADIASPSRGPDSRACQNPLFPSAKFSPCAAQNRLHLKRQPNGTNLDLRPQNHHQPCKSAAPPPPTSASNIRDLPPNISVTCHPKETRQLWRVKGFRRRSARRMQRFWGVGWTRFLCWKCRSFGVGNAEVLVLEMNGLCR